MRHIQAAYSDHDLILLTTQVTEAVTRRRRIPKRFEEVWSTHPECESIILEAWNANTELGSPMYRLFNKKKKKNVACRWLDGVEILAIQSHY